jgi:sigma-B regulation protein RsbU (phosphoserine phosphatase)
MTSSQRAIVESTVAALAAYVTAATLEAIIIRWARPTEFELEWVSDVILALAFAFAVYLWRRLLATRHELVERERAELVLDTQLSLAADIQRRLLPPVPPPDNGFEWAASLKSAGKIGGDFFDFIKTGPHNWVVLVADVSGKGIPAAMALGSLRAAFRALARQRLSPGRIVRQLSSEFLKEWKGVPYVTCIVVDFDLEARTATYTNAGHPPGLILGSDGLRRLERGGPPAGLLPRAQYEQEVVRLRIGDTCFLVSDGVTEALDGAFPLDQGVTSVRLAAASAAELCNAIMTMALDGHGPSGVADWDDDRTAVVVRVSALNARSSERRTTRRAGRSRSRAASLRRDDPSPRSPRRRAPVTPGRTRGRAGR